MTITIHNVNKSPRTPSALVVGHADVIASFQLNRMANELPRHGSDRPVSMTGSVMISRMQTYTYT